eukprot:scaffold13039_cov36-Tisochrysis_lutea.AAC.2
MVTIGDQDPQNLRKVREAPAQTRVSHRRCTYRRGRRTSRCPASAGASLPASPGWVQSSCMAHTTVRRNPEPKAWILLLQVPLSNPDGISTKGGVEEEGGWVAVECEVAN